MRDSCSSPTVARWELSRRLTRRRQSLGVKVADITKELGISRTRWSQIENDHGMIPVDSLVQLAEILKFDEVELAELVQLREAGGQVDRGWWLRYDDIVYPELLRYYGLEQGATKLSGFNATIFNGLLQVESYAEILISVSPEVSVFDRTRLLELRMRRHRQVAEDSGLKLDLVLFEPALMYSLGRPNVLAAQLDYVVTLLEQHPERISLQLLPLDSPATVASGAANFAILDFASPHLPPVVWEEDSRGRLSDYDEELAQFQRLIFTQAKDKSLDREETLHRIRMRADALRNLATSGPC